MPRPSSVEELHYFSDLTGYLRQLIEKYSLVTATRTDLLCDKDFSSKRARKLLIPWNVEQEEPFEVLEAALSSPTALAFPDLNNSFLRQTDAKRDRWRGGAAAVGWT